MIYTSKFDDCKSSNYNTYAILSDCVESKDYKGKRYPKLEHKYNMKKDSNKENNREYIYKYWDEVLSKLDPEEVYKELDCSIILSCGNNFDFCDRHIIAEWFEILLGIKVPEVRVKYYKLLEVDRPQYIKEYLEDAMRLNRNMRGFKSLRALYLFEKSEKLEEKAEELELKTGLCYDSYRQEACFLRCDADMVEDEYRELNKKKMLVR